MDQIRIKKKNLSIKKLFILQFEFKTIKLLFSSVYQIYLLRKKSNAKHVFHFENIQLKMPGNSFTLTFIRHLFQANII